MGTVFQLLDLVAYNSTGLLLVALGVWVSVRAAGFPDLTVDGSFTIGAVLFAALAGTAGTAPALAAAVLGGAVAGLATWAVNTQLGVGRVISGVLVAIILQILAPYVSSGSTASLLRVPSWFAYLDARDRELTDRIFDPNHAQLHVAFSSLCLGSVGLVLAALDRALATQAGLRLRYVGGAVEPVLLEEKRRVRHLAFGMVGGNALVGLGGAIEAHRRGGYTVSMGVGMVLVALSVIVLGEALLKARARREYLYRREQLAGVVLGTVVYVAGVQGLLVWGLARAVDLRLMSALLLLALLAYAGRVHSNKGQLF